MSELLKKKGISKKTLALLGGAAVGGLALWYYYLKPMLGQQQSTLASGDSLPLTTPYTVTGDSGGTQPIIPSGSTGGTAGAGVVGGTGPGIGTGIGTGAGQDSTYYNNYHDQGTRTSPPVIPPDQPPTQAPVNLWNTYTSLFPTSGLTLVQRWLTSPQAAAMGPVGPLLGPYYTNILSGAYQGLQQAGPSLFSVLGSVTSGLGPLSTGIGANAMRVLSPIQEQQYISSFNQVVAPIRAIFQPTIRPAYAQVRTTPIVGTSTGQYKTAPGYIYGVTPPPYVAPSPPTVAPYVPNPYYNVPRGHGRQ